MSLVQFYPMILVFVQNFSETENINTPSNSLNFSLKSSIKKETLTSVLRLWILKEKLFETVHIF